VDPVEITFDEDGRAYVAEMRDYPEDPPPGKHPRSRIRLLEDVDGDGRVDRSTLFADNLLEVTSILPWKGGVIVTAAPDILYLKDENGDGKADLRRVLFTGFAIVNPESRITNLRFGVDNWIYASNNGQQGNIRFLDQPGTPPVSVLGADFRFRLDRGLFEAESGPAQFGLTMDDWGHRFITQNTIHVRAVVLPRRYLLRNPLLAAGDLAEDISDHGKPSARMFQLTPPQYWRKVRTAMRQQRFRENNSNRVEIVAGYFTGASGGTVYAGEALPEEYYGSLFTGDVAGNLIHRDILKTTGGSFTASRSGGEQDKEFLASTDPWFRPCNFTTGPDGALYFTDMYREFIETPESVPEDLKKNMNFYSGDDLGRIYRIVPKDSRASRPARPHLSRTATSELVALLEHRNRWWRLTAQRLILERQDTSVVPALRDMFVRSPSPQGQLHALYAIDGLNSLDKDLVQAALKDSHPGVREHAVILAEKYPPLAGALASMWQDESPRVQLQLVLSLGQFPESVSMGPMAKILARYPDDRWFRTAVLSSSQGSGVRMLETLLGQDRSASASGPAGPFFEKAGAAKFLDQLAAVIGARNDKDETGRFIRLLAEEKRLRNEQLQVAGLEGLARGMNLSTVRRLQLPAAERSLTQLLARGSEEVKGAARAVARHFEIKALIDSAVRQSADARTPPEQRKQAIQFLATGSFPVVRPVFERLLAAERDPDLISLTIRSLASFEDSSVGPMLLARWAGWTPEVRKSALDALLSRNDRIVLLLDAIERRQVEPNALELPQQIKLVQNPDGQIAQRAGRLFKVEAGARPAVLESYRTAITLHGDAVRGRAGFEKNCARCHLPRKGKQAGPDLSGVSSQTKEQLLRSILDPSRVIEPRYINYIVTTRDGGIHDGVVVSETPGTLTLRSGNSEDETILRANIVDLRASRVSLMPEGLEQSLSRQDVADIIAFLQAANLRR
jgi:putative membrane-bound dehydrogenase-like protein